MEVFYQQMLYFIRKHNFLKEMILFINHYFPYITFGLYPCIIIYLSYIHSSLLLDSIIRPSIAFILVTVFRKIVNRPRPYESMSIEPLIRHKLGQSFPSRHSVSAFIIALVSFYVNVYLGIFACVIAVCISIGRILAGVHYISDVLTAILIAFIIYLI